MMRYTVKLPPDSYDFVLTRVESGRYENPSQLIDAAFRALHREESEFSSKPVTSAVAEEDVFRKLWETSGQLPMDRRKTPRLD